MDIRIKLRNDINDIIQCFIFNYNTEKTRNHMCFLISKYLDREVIDKTSVQLIDKNKYFFCVKINNNLYSLDYYINNYYTIERTLKIQKIKNKI